MHKFRCNSHVTRLIVFLFLICTVVGLLVLPRFKPRHVLAGLKEDPTEVNVHTGTGGDALAASPPFDRLININIPAFELTLFRVNDIPRRYPIAVGQPKTPTPIGRFYVTTKVVNPTWYPGGGKAPVLPGPKNPLGSRWIGLSKAHYGIHGTNAPTSIGKTISQGCIRMYTTDAEDLFRVIEIKDPVIIRYDPVEFERDEIAVNWFCIVYEDVYGIRPVTYDVLLAAARRQGVLLPAPPVVRGFLDVIVGAANRSAETPSMEKDLLSLKFSLLYGGSSRGLSPELATVVSAGAIVPKVNEASPGRSLPLPKAIVVWPEYPRFVPAE